ncbi:hypothetical protein [Nocardiopsis metallicus]|uniref:Transposase n=1 Tax=Nocardiopsis metallicus TaxID=179819 RepID=A0A840WDQ5_9ACTN|nr:hypothetical protein [Nocardiopsis metallicus]MBB5491141.1 hypothetical protein [Nocardiopsis metallicus]
MSEPVAKAKERALRPIAAPCSTPGPGGVAVRTRLEDLTGGDEQVLRAGGAHLASLACADLKARCADGTGHDRGTWSARTPPGPALVVAVDAAYASRGGAQHWQKPTTSRRRKTSRHDTASIAIGRRAQGYPIRRRTAPPRTHRSDGCGPRTAQTEPDTPGA